ncbi:hypothetical protein DL771_000311 [Monosporascus sp. 5C6A]|nr:hypothetical protein DL771_000311 [Monosporascus sp. 5C6A]
MSLEATLLHAVYECMDRGVICTETEEPELQSLSQLVPAPSLSQKIKQPSLLNIGERELKALEPAPFD